MTQHAVQGAISLYAAGTLTLEQAAGYAGLRPGALADQCRRYGVELSEHARTDTDAPAVASD